jgi:uncharacterized RDD family membrane protein YckC
LLYGLLTLPFVTAAIVLFASGLDECTTDTRTDEIVCNGAEDTGMIVAGVAVLLAGALVVILLYLRALARTGQTWGRRIVGIRVVNAETGAPPGWGKAIGRQLFAMIISSYVLYLGYLWMLWDSQNQTWHDKVAGTLVVRT